MTQKRGGKAGRQRKGTGELRSRVAETALHIAAGEGWVSVSPQRVAQLTKDNLADVLRVAPTHTALADIVFQYIDDLVLNEIGGIDFADPAKDRLFEILMIRFDALQRFRAGIQSLLSSYRQMPLAALCRFPRLVKSMEMTLCAADIPPAGGLDAMRGQVLALGYLSVLRVWQADESADMAQTMSALDKMLSRLQRLRETVTQRGT